MRRLFSLSPWRTPNRYAALKQYHRRARFYDFELALLEPIRHQAIARLALKRGDVVLDVGCGTGLSLAPLLKRVGAEGKIIGIEQSPDMIERARRRVKQDNLDNVTLLWSPVEQASIPVMADAALFHFTHDILRAPAALANVIKHLKPGARVVALGTKVGEAMAVTDQPVGAAGGVAIRDVAQGLREPWSNLARMIGHLRVEPILGGGAMSRRESGIPLRAMSALSSAAPRGKLRATQ